MSDKVSLVRVLTSATGNSTPITLGARYSDLFMTPADAGAVDGRTYTWLIVDGNNWELVKGVYTASGTTAARTTVIASRMSGTLGTSRITLSGTAQVRIVESAVDMDGVRGTRAVTGTSDALAATDLGYVVTYSNAAAVAVSLAQAGTASLYDGWATWVQNLGAGTVTITPATSTINGAATLVLPTNHGAFIWSDGTNYHAYFVPVSKPLLAGNNLADIPNPVTASNNITAVAFGGSQSLTSGQQSQARTNLGIGTGDAAVQSDQETGTSNAVAVTPGTQKYHPSAVKAWVRFNASSGTPTIDRSYNVSSLTDNGMGDTTINWTTAFSDASYCPVCFGDINTGTDNGTGRWVQIVGISSTQFRIFTATVTTTTGEDWDHVSVHATGDF